MHPCDYWRMSTHNIADAEYGPPLAVSVPVAAYKLGVSPRHIYDLIETGDLRSFKSGRRRLISFSEISRYIAERES